MTDTTSPQPTVIRTSRGLSIAGRRLTLYSIMDYLQAGWPPTLIRDEFNLTDKQMADVITYIELHRDEVEQEYQAVLQHAEEFVSIGKSEIAHATSMSLTSPLIQGKKRFAPDYKLQRRGLVWCEQDSR